MNYLRDPSDGYVDYDGPTRVTRYRAPQMHDETPEIISTPSLTRRRGYKYSGNECIHAGPNIQSPIPGCYIVHADFQHRDLRGWDFSGCTIVHANFHHADLRDTKWNGAKIVHGHFQNSDLRGSNLLTASQMVHRYTHGAKTGPSDRHSGYRGQFVAKTLEENWLQQIREEQKRHQDKLEERLSLYPSTSEKRKVLDQILKEPREDFRAPKVIRAKNEIVSHTDPLFRTVIHGWSNKEIRTLADWLIDNRQGKVSMAGLSDFLIATNQEDRIWCGLHEQYTYWTDVMNKDDLDPKALREFLVHYGPLGDGEIFQSQESILRIRSQDPNQAIKEREEDARAHYEKQESAQAGKRLQEKLAAKQDLTPDEKPKSPRGIQWWAQGALNTGGLASTAYAIIHFLF